MRYTKGGRLKRRKITLTPRELGRNRKGKIQKLVLIPLTAALPTEGQLHFSTNLRENANARGIWQQWPWSVPPILRVGFLVEARERGGGRGEGGKVVRESDTERIEVEKRRSSGKGRRRVVVVEGWVEQGELCRPCKAERSTEPAAVATPDDRPRLYTGSPNPLIRVDSHDRLEGTHPPTHLSSAQPPSPVASYPHSSLSLTRHSPPTSPLAHVPIRLTIPQV